MFCVPVKVSEKNDLPLHIHVLCMHLLPYSANISRAINFVDFNVSLQSVKIISIKMSRRL